MRRASSTFSRAPRMVTYSRRGGTLSSRLTKVKDWGAERPVMIPTGSPSTGGTGCAALSTVSKGYLAERG